MSQVDFEQIDNIIEEIKKHIHNEKLKLAYTLYSKLLEKIEEKEKEDLNEETKEKLLEKKKLLLDDKVFIRLKKDYSNLLKVIDELSTSDGWTLQRDDNGTQTYFKQPNNSPVYLVKAVGKLNANPFNVLALINEIELFHLWIPTIQQGRIDYNISDFKKVVYLKVSPPSPLSWVVSEREMLLYAYGVDMMEENRLFAVVRSLTDEDLHDLRDQFPDYKFRKEIPSIVRMQCHVAGIEIVPIDENTTRVSLVTCVDPKIVLPYWIINIVTKQFAHMILSFLGKHASHLSQEYNNRINKQDGVYQNIKSRLNNGDNDK